jgi:L-alanine-DL-glutamate epimerase-like enolase superfamily enzyme
MEPELARIAADVAADMALAVPVPSLCALVSFSPIDAAMHDAYGKLYHTNSFNTLDANFLAWDLSRVLGRDFAGIYPSDYLRFRPVAGVPIAHTVGALDPLTPDEARAGRIPPLSDWIARDAPFAFKVKLKGQDVRWDMQRLVDVHDLAMRALDRGNDIVLYGDLNEQGTSTAYLVELLDRLEVDEPAVYAALDMLEQPLPRGFANDSPDLDKISARVPIVLDEGLTSLGAIDRALALGWGGIALKTCKTQSLMLLALAKAVAAGIQVTVQDLTNPGIALVQSVGLASRLPVTKPFETNVQQYFPLTSRAEAELFPGIFHIQAGQVMTAGIDGPGFGYRVPELTLPN